MKWLKVCALVIVTLTAMRAAGWAVAWTLMLLYASLLPGEPVDPAAVAFGLVVFGAYTLTDFRWTPWKSRTSLHRRP